MTKPKKCSLKPLLVDLQRREVSTPSCCYLSNTDANLCINGININPPPPQKKKTMWHSVVAIRFLLISLFSYVQFMLISLFEKKKGSQAHLVASPSTNFITPELFSPSSHFYFISFLAFQKAFYGYVKG